MTDFDVPLARREAVARQLRAEILSGQLPPGTLLKDAELAARLGMSITPVREAITQLAAEGLVDISPNRTRKVAGLTLKSALDLVDVMELLACAGFAATRMKAMVQGAVPLFTQLWMVPRCTSTSPAFRCTVLSSNSMSISPDMITA